MEKYTENKIQEELSKLDGWAYTKGYIVREVTFHDFKEAFAFMVRAAFEAENMDHHPDWTNVYNSVHIKLQTHSARGITEKDFELAIRIEKILKS